MAARNNFALCFTDAKLFRTLLIVGGNSAPDEPCEQMKSYSRDPYWMTARFDGPSSNRNGQPIKKGDRIFYYPNGRQSFVGAEAEAAAADFQSHADDEAMMNGGMEFGSENY